jgi:cytochrome c-type biogenesis protein CcmF
VRFTSAIESMRRFTSLSSNPFAVIGVIVEPLVSWLWIGGGLMAVGTLLAVWPGERRRRPTAPSTVTSADEEPVSA